MNDQESPAVRAGHEYFRETPMRAEKGSAMSMIAADADKTRAKNDRLKAARMERDEAEQKEIAAAAAAAPVKRKRKAAATS